MYLSLWKQSNVFLRFSLVISCFATLALAQNLAFLSPDLTPVVSGGALPHYTVGDYVGVSWTTPFEETNLLVYQLKESAYAYEVLALNYNKSTTFFVWYAQAVDGQPLNTAHPFHFVLENAKSFSCNGCVTQSPDFNVRKQQPQSGTTSSSTPKSTSGAGGATTSQPTQAHQTQQSQTKQFQTQHSQTQKHTAAPSTAGATGQDRSTPSPSSSKSNHDLGIGLGVGLGVGIPVVLVIAGLCFLLARKRRKDKRVSYHPTGSGNWTAEPKPRPESDVLGPWAVEARRQSGLSQASRQSYLDPFDFEKAETRDQDALSQLRRSIHSSGSDYSQKGMDVDVDTPSSAKASSSTRETSWPLQSNNGNSRNDANTKYAWMGGPTGATKAGSGWGAGAAAARRSDVSHANTDLSSLEGMPEQLQPVHHHRYSPEYGIPPAKREYTGAYSNGAYSNGAYSNGAYSNGANSAAYASRGDGRDWPLP